METEKDNKVNDKYKNNSNEKLDLEVSFFCLAIYFCYPSILSMSFIAARMVSSMSKY